MDIFLSIVTFSMGVAIYWYFYKKTKDSMNPWGVTVIAFCFAAALGMSHVSPLQTPWNVTTYVIIWLFPIVVLAIGAGVKINQSRKVIYNKFCFSNGYTTISRLIFVISILCSLIEWGQQGFALTLINADGFDSKDSWEVISFINYGTQLLPYIAIASFFELVFRKNLRKRDKYVCMGVIAYNVFYTMMCQVSRGSMLIFLLGILFIITRVKQFNIKKISIIIIIILVASYVFVQMRMGNAESLVFNVVPGQPFISSIYGYTGLNFENLNKLIIEGADYSIVGRSLGGVLQLFGGESIANFTAKHQTVFFNAVPIVYDFYDDLGALGVVIYTALYFGIVGYIYKRSFYDARYILLIAAMQKAVVCSFYGNYFAAYRVLLFPFLVVAFMIFSFRFVYRK